MNPVITSLIERGTLFVVNHSGGKDSQALYAEYVQLEKEINHTLSMDGTPLEVTTGIKAS